MKSIKVKLLVLCACLFWANQADAQLGGFLKNVLGNSVQKDTSEQQSSGVVSSLLQHLIGTEEVDNANLKGKWSYESPAVVFESSNFLQKAGGTLVTNTLEKTLQKNLNKIGFEAGKVEFEFDGDSTYTIKIGGRLSEGTYHVEGSNITLARKGVLSYPVTANVAIEGSEMQMTFKADRLLDFLTRISSLSNNSMMNTIGKVAGSYDGMQLGFQFKRY